MNNWIYCHECYAPKGAKIGLPENGQRVLVSHIDKKGNRYVSMGQYVEEMVLDTNDAADYFPPEGIMLSSRNFMLVDDHDAVVPYDEEDVYEAQHAGESDRAYIGYAWKPIEEPAETEMNGFPQY